MALIQFGIGFEIYFINKKINAFNSDKILFII